MLRNFWQNFKVTPFTVLLNIRLRFIETSQCSFVKQSLFHRENQRNVELHKDWCMTVHQLISKYYHLWIAYNSTQRCHSFHENIPLFLADADLCLVVH
jgi:hypothetical protein